MSSAAGAMDISMRLNIYRINHFKYSVTKMNED